MWRKAIMPRLPRDMVFTRNMVSLKRRQRLVSASGLSLGKRGRNVPAKPLGKPAQRLASRLDSAPRDAPVGSGRIDYGQTVRIDYARPLISLMSTTTTAVPCPSGPSGPNRAMLCVLIGCRQSSHKVAGLVGLV